MPNLLITTSRRTSNRIRSFARDLWSVLPSSDRFNRGGMGIGELVSRIATSGADAALVISTWKGNPGDLTFLLPDGREDLVLRVESAVLRREVNETGRPRVRSIAGIFLKSHSEAPAATIAEVLGTILGVEVVEAESVPLDGTAGRVAIWLESLPSGKTLWTHHHTMDGKEIGPRIRVKSLRRSDVSELH